MAEVGDILRTRVSPVELLLPAALTVLIYRILGFWLPVVPGAVLLRMGTFGPGDGSGESRS